jgi:NitT/TauT family transport system substrate-binding protein
MPPSILARLLFLGGCVFLAGCGRPAPVLPHGSDRPLTKVIFQTDWFAEPEHGGFYEALAKGYYRDAGLDVAILQGGPATAPTTMVATGRADFGMERSDAIIIRAARGVPLVMVGAFMQRDPQAIMFHRESGIRSFRDLDGRNIMAVPGSAYLPIMEDAFHIKVSVTPTDFGMSRFLADKNFIQQCFITNEPYYVRKHGANVGTLLVSDTGFSPYRVWYTSRGFLAAHPDIVRAFSQASIRGWREYIDGDGTAADARITFLNPRMDRDFMAFSVQAMKTYGLVTGGAGGTGAIGRIDRARIATQIKQLAEVGLLDKPVTVDDVFDSRFQP